MYSCEGIGKNIEQAIENALFELKASREDVDIKILNQGGFLKKAKVLVTISPDAVEKYEKKNALKEKLEKEEKKESEEKEEQVASESHEETMEESGDNNAIEESSDVNIEGAENSAETALNKEEKSSRKVKSEAKDVDAKELLIDVLKALGLTAEITADEDDKYIHYMITGENLNGLIGYHGEALYALSCYVSNVCKAPNHKRIVIDINDYRSKRAETLRNLAKNVADKVAKSGRYYKFDPMDASERKVIHTALQEDGRVTTMSKGEEPHRYLMVFPVDSEVE